MNQHTPGLSFKKLDLHIHTPASKCFLATQVTPSQIVQSALDAGLAGIAVTDHNSAAWIERVQLAAKQHLVVFPGVEITCMGGITGIHIIALFDPACKQAHVEGLLASLGLRPEDHGKIETVVQKSPSDVIDAIVSKGGLPVLAHANSSNGAFCDMKGQQRIKLIRHPRLCAVEARDFANKELAARNKRVIDLLDGADPEYETHLAVYQASDNPAAEGSGKHGLAGIGSRCAYFKMDAVTLAGLEQAFNDPIVRIRQDFEYKTYEYPRISRLRVVGAFLDGLDVQLHDGLTSILGAKGSGKSLLVEFLRFVLDQPSSNTGIRQDHEAKLEARLEEFGTVAVDFRDETGRELSVRRTYGSGDMGGYDEDSPEEVARLFPVLFLSQNEIIRIAENEEEQIQFIDRFFDFRTYISEIATLEGGLGREDRALAESLRSYTAVQELEQALKLQKRETLKLDSALKNEVFENFRLAEIKRRAFQEQISFIENRIEILESLGREVLSNDDPLLPDSVETDPALKRTHAILKTGRASLKEKIEDLIDEVRNNRDQIETEFKRWLPKYRDVKIAYKKIVQETGGDYKALASSRAKLIKKQDGILLKLREAKSHTASIKQIVGRRNGLLDKLTAVYAKYTEERRAKCRLFEKESNGHLRVSIRSGTNKDAFRQQLRALKKGSRLRDSDIDRLCDKIAPTEFVNALIRFALSHKVKYYAQVAEGTGIDKERLGVLFQFLLDSFDYERLLKMQYTAIPTDRPEIAYKVGGDNYEFLSRLSTGQKCTALLMMALSDGTMPVVIDQPEDSLDIRSVWEDMCLKVRGGKEKRQFIFTTHNSSLAVAGDTDKFLILEATADTGSVVYSGSMDEGPVSEEVLKYLEGGPDTYRLKYRKYSAERILARRTSKRGKENM